MPRLTPPDQTTALAEKQARLSARSQIDITYLEPLVSFRGPLISNRKTQHYTSFRFEVISNMVVAVVND